MPMVLELCDEDVEVMLRVHRQRQLRELDLREPNPEPGPEIAGRIRATGQQGGFYWTCVCNKPLSSPAATGTCPECGAEFDFTGFGK